MEMNNKDAVLCAITRDVCSKNINSFDDLMNMVIDKYGDMGILIVSIKTNFFKEIIDSNCQSWHNSLPIR